MQEKSYIILSCWGVTSVASLHFSGNSGFKRATGDTPLCYLQKIRVEAAKKMIETKSATFEEICYRTGYENAGHFREIFKKHTGLLPGRYELNFRCEH